MVGILVHGNNHFILGGPRPDQPEAVALARHFSLIQIGAPAAATFEKWQIRDKEFRENLEWAVVVPGERGASPGVLELLVELEARGIKIEKYTTPAW
jgi:hypothetical protein